MKDDLLDEISQIDIKVKFAIRAFFYKILPAIVVAVYTFVLWSKIPEKGVYIFQMFKLAPLSFPPIFLVLMFLLFLILKKIFLEKNNIVFLSLLSLIGLAFGFKFLFPKLLIAKFYLDIGMFSLIVSMLLYSLYFVTYAYTGFVEANPRKLYIHDGVFNRNEDPEDMTNIDDCNKKTPFHFRIIGIVRLEVIFKRGEEKIKYLLLPRSEGNNLFKYIDAHAFGNSTEYWTTRDRMRNKKKDMKYIEDIDGNDTEDGEEIEPQE